MKSLYTCNLIFLLFLLQVPGWAQQRVVTLPSDTLMHPREIQLPRACDFLSTDSVAMLVGRSVGEIMVVEPPVVGEQGVSGCFYKWDDETTPHAGIFIQIMKNPAFDSYPGYIQFFVDEKLAAGEAMPGRGGRFIYEELYVGESRVAWSAEQARFYWTSGKNHLFMLAVNKPGLPVANLLELGKKVITSVHLAMLSPSVVK